MTLMQHLKHLMIMPLDGAELNDFFVLEHFSKALTFYFVKIVRNSNIS